MSDNLKLWAAVCETPPSATKSDTRNGRTITSIDGIYLVKKATEIFGKIGEGWGYVVLDDRIDEGAPIFVKDKLECFEKVHTLKLALWYVGADGEKKQVIHYGHTPFVMKTRNGPVTDQDAAKKSLTDAMKKCLYMLGFSADVNEGQFDDKAYIQHAVLKESLSTEDGLIAAIDDFNEWFSSELKAYAFIPNLDSLSKVWKGHSRKVLLDAPLLKLSVEELQNELDSAYWQRHAQLSPRTETANA